MASVSDLDDLDISSWLDWMGIDYRRTSGSHGIQLNLRECPVCGGDKWKVYINEETGLGNCFHGDCEAKFNKYKFIKASLGTNDFREVMKNIDEYLEANDWKPKDRKPEVKVEEPLPFNLPAYVKLPYMGRNLTYLTRRNISKEATEYFELGFCQNGYFEYKNPEGQIARRDFSNRVIIPIRDIDGKIVTFQGRDITGESQQRYLFPCGVRSTGSLFYNGHHAVGAEQVVICEGVFDVIAVWQVFQNDPGMRSIVPIGSFGKHISFGDDPSQIAYLLKLKEQGLRVITMMWDGEPVAIHDACTTALELKKYGFTVRIALLPGKDPNDLPEFIIKRAYWDAENITSATATKIALRYPRLRK